MPTAILPLLALACLPACAAPAAKPQETPPPAADTAGPIAFRGARLVPIAGEEIGNGVVVIERGKIVAVGPADTTPIPAGARVRDVAGRVITPGLVDTHSHIGQPAGADGSSPIQPDCRVLDSIDARDASIQRAQAGGITVANVMPGSGHLLSGQTLYLKLRDGSTVDDLLIRLEGGRVAGGMKMANGTNSRGNPPFPGTRAKSAALVREQFVRAQEYQRKLERAGGDPEKAPERDLNLEALAEVLRGERVVQHHTHRHDDVLTVLRLQEEFGFKVVLHHVSDAWKVAPEIAKAKIPCSIILVDSPGGKLEAKDVSWESGAALERAGVSVAFHTDDPITDSRLFARSAALAVRAGMSRRAALAALTIEGARILGLEGRVGTLEAGKDADLVLWSGDPLSVYAQVLETWVDGARVFDRSDPKDRLWAEGGLGAGQGRLDLSCCGPEEER